MVNGQEHRLRASARGCLKSRSVYLRLCHNLKPLSAGSLILVHARATASRLCLSLFSRPRREQNVFVSSTLKRMHMHLFAATTDHAYTPSQLKGD